MKTQPIGFIGGGNMAASLITGLIESGHEAGKIWVSDINENALRALAAKTGVNVVSDNNRVVDEVDVIVMAVKPQALKGVAEHMAEKVQQQKNVLVVSIAAGIRQQSLSTWLGGDVAVVRCMPNTPALVMTGATALFANEKVNEKQRTLAEKILRAVGLAIWVGSEAELDVVTAVSGSGPAYYFLLMEAMEEAAVEMGMSQETARLLIQQTALGAAKIALEAEESPARLRERVTSPGGTTQQAIETFQQGGFTQLVSKALHAAKDRSIEMSKELGI